jgi:hypothetical protein
MWRQQTSETRYRAAMVERGFQLGVLGLSLISIQIL